MDGLLVHPLSLRQLHAQLGSPSHALLIIGARGMGKTAVARAYAQEILGGKPLDKQAQYREYASDDDAIVIDDIRNIREFVKRKVAGDAEIRRVCLLDEVDRMTTEAANAMLKMLEEPHDDTVFVLTASSATAVPDTVKSRCHIVELHHCSLRDSHTFFGQKHSEIDVAKAHAVSDGRPALMAAILSSADEHPLVAAITEAKQLLTAKQYDRLSHVDAISKDKQRLDMLLFGLERVTSSLVKSTVGNPVQAKRAHHALQATAKAQRSYAARANTKLLLTDLFLNL
jgi:DNA polymerase-3 subunit delta'